MELTDFKTGKNGKAKRKAPLDLSTMIYGKVPPQARDLEEAVIGAILRDKAGFDLAIQILKPECFYIDAHQRIFKAFVSLANKSQPIDELTVVQELLKSEELDIVGGPYYITKTTNAVISSAHIEFHARIVFEKWLQREMIKVGGEMITDAYEDSTDAFVLLDQSEAKLFEISNAMHGRKEELIDSLLVKAVQVMENRRHEASKSDDYISGVPSGFKSIDQVTHGWQNTDLIILAARPSVGKTALAIQLARNAALDPVKPTPTAIFSLEMSSGQLLERLISSESEIGLEKIKKGKLEDSDMETIYKKAIQKLSEAKLFIDDTPALNIWELRAKCRRLKNVNNIGLIIIDYLQLMSGIGDRNSNREQEISNISRNLKILAKELQVPIIALSQLSREVEKRKEGFMPKLSDLRESGAIEQDADSVVFIYRPEYHDIQHNAVGDSSKGETHLKFAKHRNGTNELIKLRAELHIQKFREMELQFHGAPDFRKRTNETKQIDDLSIDLPF